MALNSLRKDHSLMLSNKIFKFTSSVHVSGVNKGTINFIEKAIQLIHAHPSKRLQDDRFYTFIIAQSYLLNIFNFVVKKTVGLVWKFKII